MSPWKSLKVVALLNSGVGVTLLKGRTLFVLPELQFKPNPLVDSTNESKKSLIDEADDISPDEFAGDQEKMTRQSQTKQSPLFRRKNSEEIELAKDVTVSESYDMFTNVG